MNNQCSNACTLCKVKKLCLASSLSEPQMELMNNLVTRKKPLQRGESLFTSEEKFRSLYIVRAGSFKVSATDPEGTEQVYGFYLPGDILGLGGDEKLRYGCTAMALETSSVCELTLDGLDHLSSTVHGVGRQVFEFLSREIRRSHDLQRLLCRKTADERIWGFLIDISNRHAALGLSPERFKLPMSRVDIANYVGLAVETVSRIMTRLQNHGLIEIDGKQIVLLTKRETCPSLKVVPVRQSSSIQMISAQSTKRIGVAVN